MRKAEANWDLNRVDVSFPYIRLLVSGRPERETERLLEKHPPMDRGHRAKIFAPFDALDGFSAQIRQKNRLFEEAAPEKTMDEPCEFREEP